MLSAASLLLFFSFFVVTYCNVYDAFYERLAEELLSQQYNATTSYTTRGLFASDIRMNIVGRLSYTREEAGSSDNNFFVSAWIAQILWEIRSLNITNSLREEIDLEITHAVDDSLSALQLFRNQNTKQSNVLSVSFWQQQYKKRCDCYCATQQNIEHSITELDALILFLSIEAAKHGLNITEIVDMDYYVFYATEMFDESFGISADNDDTSVALALTTFYKETPNQFDHAADIWLNSVNYSFASNIQSFADRLIQYNYRPFSSDINYNYIDSRSYYWLRHFIYRSLEYEDINTETRGEELVFVSTWQLSFDENEYNVQHRICYQQPFSVNNVEPTVGANVIYAITRSLIWFAQDREQWFSPQIQQIYRNTTNLLSWIIESDWINKRPELIFLYYPSRHDFYWFLSRTYNVYNNYIVNSERNKGIMEQYPFLWPIYYRLQSALQHNATRQLLDTAQSDTANGTIVYFWDDFIGNNDLNVAGESDPHYDDRLFSTSMAINALLNIWSVCDVEYNANDDRYRVTNISWVQKTPSVVTKVVEGAVLFLRKESFNNERYPPENAFFSGSQKTNETDPWYYPINFFQFRNGTAVDWKKVTRNDVRPGNSCGIKGYVDEETYEEMIHYGAILGPVPDAFTGYNHVGQPWPYWSSPSITRAATLLAVGKYDTINKKSK